MIENIKTPKDGVMGLFARLLQQGDGQTIIDNWIADLKARNTYTDPKYYTRLKADLNKILQAPSEQQADLIEELEKAIAAVARYARWGHPAAGKVPIVPTLTRAMMAEGGVQNKAPPLNAGWVG